MGQLHILQVSPQIAGRGFPNFHNIAKCLWPLRSYLQILRVKRRQYEVGQSSRRCSVVDHNMVLCICHATIRIRSRRHEVSTRGFLRCIVTVLTETSTSGLITADRFKMTIFGTLTPSSSISGLVVAIYEIGAFVGSIAVMVYGKEPVLWRRRLCTVSKTDCA